MNRILATLAPICAVVTVLAAQPPQDPPKRPPANEGANDARRPGAGQEHIAMGFSGGTLEQCVAALRKAAPAVSILLNETVRSYQVPSLEVNSNEVEPVLQAVALVVRPKVVVHATGARVFAITEAGGEEGPPEQQVTIIKIKDNLPGEEIPPELVEAHAQNVLSAIAEGLGLGEARRAANEGSLRYHRETGLIFVRGTAAQGTKAREIFNMVDFDAKQLERQMQREKEQDPRNRRDK